MEITTTGVGLEKEVFKLKVWIRTPLYFCRDESALL
jgi:hypothetical protein